MRAQRLRGAAVAAFTTAAVLAAPIVTANAAHAGTDEGGSQVSSAVFQWAMNDESGSAGYDCFHLSSLDSRYCSIVNQFFILYTFRLKHP